MDENIYIELLHKQLTDGLSPPEEKQLQAWIAASEENHLTAQSVQTAWEATDTLKSSVEVNLDAEFAVLEKKMKEEKPMAEIKSTTKVRTLSSGPRRWMSIAAGVIFVVAAGFILRQFLSNASQAEWVEVTTEKVNKTITLPDDSTIELYSGTTLRYQQPFLKERREVELEGRAFFKIAHNAEQPFLVGTSHEIVRVLGTSFEVEAINKNDMSKVSVTDGKVEVRLKKGGRKAILEKGQYARIDRTSQQIARNSFDVNQFGFKTGIFEFDDIPLQKSLILIGGYYKVRINVESPQLANCLWTATFDNASLKEVFETLSTVLGVEVAQTGEIDYILKGETCG